MSQLETDQIKKNDGNHFKEAIYYGLFTVWTRPSETQAETKAGSGHRLDFNLFNAISVSRTCGEICQLGVEHLPNGF